MSGDTESGLSQRAREAVQFGPSDPIFIVSFFRAPGWDLWYGVIMGKKKVERDMTEASVGQAQNLDELHEIRGTIRSLQEREREVQRSVVQDIGEADGMVSDRLEALLVRCEGAVAWKRVVDTLVNLLEIPPGVVRSAVEGATGQGFIQLRLKERQ